MGTEATRLETVTLRDGRTLAYATYGDPEGSPVFWFHGFPGSRLEPVAGHLAVMNRLDEILGVLLASA